MATKKKSSKKKAQPKQKPRPISPAAGAGGGFITSMGYLSK